MDDGGYIRRARKSCGYAQIANATVDDPAISYKALGVLVHLLAKPADWQCRVRALVRATDRRDAVRSALLELREAGYASLVVEQAERGHRRTVYFIFDRPEDNDVPDPARRA